MSLPGSSNLSYWRKIGQIIPDWLGFLRNPTLINSYDNMSLLSWNRLWLLFLFGLALDNLLIVGPLDAYQEAMDIADPDLFGEQSLSLILIELVILAPLLEESLFRGWLTGKKRGQVAFAFATSWIIILLVSDAWGGGESEANGPLALITIILFVWCIFELRAVWHTRETSVVFQNHFGIIFWCSALLFGLLHITNYDHDSYLELIPLVIPQFIGGLMLGYVRLRYGLAYAMLHHGAYNGVLFLFFFL